MCADHGDRVAWLPFGTNREGDDRGAVSCKVVFPARLQSAGPRVPLADFTEAGGGQAGDG